MFLFPVYQEALKIFPTIYADNYVILSVNNFDSVLFLLVGIYIENNVLFMANSCK